MNQEKLKAMQESVRIGGKGTARRKKKVTHRTATTDDKKLQSSLKKLSVNNIPGIEEVNMMKNDGSVIHFNNPKVQASLAANTFAVTGQSETKQITEMLPGILNQLGAESLQHLKRLATSVGAGGPGAGSESKKDTIDEEEDDDDDDDDDVPDLVENFDEASKNEEKAAEAKVVEVEAPAEEPASQAPTQEPAAVTPAEPETVASKDVAPAEADETPAQVSASVEAPPEAQKEAPIEAETAPEEAATDISAEAPKGAETDISAEAPKEIIAEAPAKPAEIPAEATVEVAPAAEAAPVDTSEGAE